MKVNLTAGDTIQFMQRQYRGFKAGNSQGNMLKIREISAPKFALKTIEFGKFLEFEYIENEVTFTAEMWNGQFIRSEPKKFKIFTNQISDYSIKMPEVTYQY
jgi:hypothetical protein